MSPQTRSKGDFHFSLPAGDKRNRAWSRIVLTPSERKETIKIAVKRIASACAAVAVYFFVVRDGLAQEAVKVLASDLKETQAATVNLEFMARIAVAIYVFKTLADIFVKPLLASRKGPSTAALGGSEIHAHFQETHDSALCVERAEEMLGRLLNVSAQIQQGHVILIDAQKATTAEVKSLAESVRDLIRTEPWNGKDCRTIRG